MYLRSKKILIVSLLVTVVVLASVAICTFFIIREFYWDDDSGDNEICINTKCISQSELFQESESSYVCSREKCVISSSNISDVIETTCISMECITRGDKDKYSKINSTTICLNTMCLRASLVVHLEAGGNCSTKDCIVSTAEVLNLMDQNIKPCYDFYEFSCHGSLKNTIPEIQKKYNIGKALNETLSAPIRLSDSDSLKKIKKVYQKCVNQGSTKIRDFTFLSDVLKRTEIGDWPILESKNVNRNCRSEMALRTAMLHMYGVETFFRLEVVFSQADSKAFIKMTVAPPLFEGICSEGSEESRRKNVKYTDMLNKIFLHLLKDAGRARRAAEGIKEFDRLFCIATKKNASAEDEPSKITLEELSEISPEFNWKLWHSIISSEFDIDARLKSAPIYAYDVHLHIENILKLVSTKSSWINYLSMKFMLSYMGFLDRPLREIMMEYSSAFKDHTAYAIHPVNFMPLWEQCQTYLERVMGIALIPRFATEIITVGVKREMEYLGELVEHSFKETFHRSSVLYDEEKQQIMKTITKFGVHLPYPEENSTWYDEYFDSMEPSENSSFLETGMQVRFYHQKKIFQAVYRGAHDYDLELKVLLQNPFESHAFAAITENKTSIFIGGMHVAHVKPDLPRYMNFATLGTTIALQYVIGSHLLSVKPGKDTFDLKAKEWRPWPEEIRHHVAEKRQCYVDKYSSQTQENGDLVVQEMMANVQALKESLQAYRMYCKKYGHEPLLPLPHLNEEGGDDKLFFILYAQAFCSMHSAHQPDEDVSLMAGAKRVNEVLRNLEEFADVFHCESDSPMNPSDKCETIW